MKVIFLDIDGVLNTSKTYDDIEEEYLRTGKSRVDVDSFRIGYLKEIVSATDAKIVLSSSWKNYGYMLNGLFIPVRDKMKEFVQVLHFYGLSIYDVTPNLLNGIRQDEINAWLEGKNVDSFIILDDDSYELQNFLHKELIKTSTTKDDEMVKSMDDYIGLCEEHIPLAIQMLNQKVIESGVSLKKVYPSSCQNPVN